MWPSTKFHSRKFASIRVNSRSTPRLTGPRLLIQLAVDDLQGRDHLRSVVGTAVREGPDLVRGPHEVAVGTDRAGIPPRPAGYGVGHITDVLPADERSELHDRGPVGRPARLFLKEVLAREDFAVGGAARGADDDPELHDRWSAGGDGDADGVVQRFRHLREVGSPVAQLILSDLHLAKIKASRSIDIGVGADVQSV